jgi:hypothetical protein
MIAPGCAPLAPMPPPRQDKAKRMVALVSGLDIGGEKVFILVVMLWCIND